MSKKKKEKKDPKPVMPTTPTTPSIAPTTPTTPSIAPTAPKVAPTTISTTQDPRLGVGIDDRRIELPDQDINNNQLGVNDDLGISTLDIPTTPGTITTDVNGNFSFSFNLTNDDDVKYYIEVYERKEPDYSQGLQQLFRQDKELTPLFNTKGCYEGTWGKKKLSLNKMKDHKEMQKSLVEKGLNFEWNIDETQPPEMKFEPRAIIQPQEIIESEPFTTQIKTELPINFPLLFEDPILPPKVNVLPVQPIDIQNDIVTKFNDKALRVVLQARLSSMITQTNGEEISPNFDPIMTAPKINDSMYNPLKKISLDYILPGIGNIDNNTVFLLEENRRVIESYLIGLNNEANRELLWREFPTDQRGTVFSYFWDPARLELFEEGETKKGAPRIDFGGPSSQTYHTFLGMSSDNDETRNRGDSKTYVPPPDIDEIHTWKKSLGSNKTSEVEEEEEGEANLVLVIKGDVIRRYPEIIVYALKFDKVIRTIDDYKDSEQELIEPLFRGQLGDDIGIWGFPLSVEDLTEASNVSHFFVLQEQQDLPVFGFDLNQSSNRSLGGNPTWEGEGQIRSRISDNLYIEDFSVTISGTLDNSAEIAATTLQLPVRVAIDSKALFMVPSSEPSRDDKPYLKGYRPSQIRERPPDSKKSSTLGRDRLRK